MCDRPWETMTDADFEAMLARSVPDTPPEEIVAEVTPWRRADVHREHHPLGRADEYRPLRRLFPAAAWGALPRLCRLLHHRGARRQYSQQRSVLHPPAELAAISRRDGDGKAPDGRLGRHGRVSHRAGCAAVRPGGRRHGNPAVRNANRPGHSEMSGPVCCSAPRFTGAVCSRGRPP